MNDLVAVLEIFANSEYYWIFLALTLIILAVLVFALMKTKYDYDNMLNSISNEKIETKVEETSLNKENNEISSEDNDILEDFENLLATSQSDIIDENTPLVKQIDTSSIKTYDDIIEDYENSEEENAVISTDELLNKVNERKELLGINSNQIAIQQYEEEQEKKAIISYEQLLKNASNITLSYKEEDKKEGCPKINKIEVEEREITQVENYIDEEEFLNILKEFRLTL